MNKITELRITKTFSTFDCLTYIYIKWDACCEQIRQFAFCMHEITIMKFSLQAFCKIHLKPDQRTVSFVMLVDVVSSVVDVTYQQKERFALFY